MVKGNGIGEHRRFVRARVSTIISRCPICILENKNTITPVKRIAELHHIFGRDTGNPDSIKESIFGVIPLCVDHHQEYPPLHNIESYLRHMDKWDKLFDAYWSYIGIFNFISDEEREIKIKLLKMSNMEFVEYFLGGADGIREKNYSTRG